MNVIEINPKNPDERILKKTIQYLNAGGLIIYPTDTVYAMGCSLMQPKAIEQLCKLKGMRAEKLSLSFICKDISHVSAYTLPISNTIFKLVKKCLPGPYTFILKANNEVPRILQVKKKTVGIRIPDHKIPVRLVELLDHPLITASIKSDDIIQEYLTEPDEIAAYWDGKIDLMLDAGACGNIPSTIIDCSEGTPILVRQGAGAWEY